MADLDLNWVANRAEVLGYWPGYVALIRKLRVVQRSPLVLSGPKPAIEQCDLHESSEATGEHSWWLRHELPFLLGEPCTVVAWTEA